MNYTDYNYTNLLEILIGGYTPEVIHCPEEMQLEILNNIPKDSLASFASVSTLWRKFSDSKYQENEVFKKYKELETREFKFFIDIKVRSEQEQENIRAFTCSYVKWGVFTFMTISTVFFAPLFTIILLIPNNNSHTLNTTF